MGINTIMRNAMQTRFCITDDFLFTFHSASRELNVKDTNLSAQEILDMCIMSVNLPEVSSSTEAVLQGGEYRIYNAIFRPFEITATFRDFGSTDLRNYFASAWMDSQRGYFDDVACKVSIQHRGKVMFESSECLVTSVSQVELDNGSTQVAEFTVSMTSPYYTNDEISKFGSDAYRPETSTGGSVNNPVGGVSGAFSTVSSAINQGSSVLGDLQGIVGKVQSWF